MGFLREGKLVTTEEVDSPLVFFPFVSVLKTGSSKVKTCPAEEAIIRHDETSKLASISKRLSSFFIAGHNCPLRSYELRRSALTASVNRPLQFLLFGYNAMATVFFNS